MKLTTKINKALSNYLGIAIVKQLPRHSIKFAKEHFKNKPISAIEIGTYEGFNALSILKTLNVEKLYIIDPYEEYKDYLDSENEQTQNQLSKVEKKARKKLQKYSDKIVWIKKYSDEAIKKIKEKVDLVYIDGNHEYKYVKSDLENYYKLIKNKGILSGHDIASFPGVAKALIEFCNNKKLTPVITITDFYITKKE